MDKRYLIGFLAAVAFISGLLIATAPQKVAELDTFIVYTGTVESIDDQMLELKTLSNIHVSAALTEQTQFREGLTFDTINQGDILKIEGLQSDDGFAVITTTSIFPHEFTQAELIFDDLP